MPRQFIRDCTRRFQPAIDRIKANPTILRYAPAVGDPDLWHLNRRSTARAVAIGLFCGLIPGPFQVLGSVIGCLIFRSNFPLTVITTFYTNPFTIVPLYVIAYEYGRLLFPDAPPAPMFVTPESTGLGDMASALGTWMMTLGKPLAAGLLLLATTLAALGWVIVRVAWRIQVVSAWRRRARRRLRRARRAGTTR